MKMKIGSLLLGAMLMISMVTMAWAESSDIRILQNGAVVPFLAGEGQVVVDENGRTLVPVRKVAGILGAEVDWLSETRTVVVKKGAIILKIIVGEQSIRSGEKIILMDTAAKIIDDRTYLPLRAVSENLGYTVLWDPAARTIGFEEGATAPVVNQKPGRTALSQLDIPVAGDLVAVMKTSLGDIHIKLLPQEAPKAVENFKGLVDQGYYNNLIFHRVIPDFMIQSGDPLGTGYGGKSFWGTPFADEFSSMAHNFRGALSMANSGANSNGSQFFIVQSPAKAMEPAWITYGTEKLVADAYKRLGGTPFLDGKHTVFGQVYAGLEVVDKIAAVKRDAKDKPLEAVTIFSVTIETVK